MKVLTTITRRGSQKWLRAGYDPIASGLSRGAVRGRPFLSEHADDNRFRYYKGGLGVAVTRLARATEDGGLRCANPPYELYDAYAVAIRQEFAHVEDRDYRAGRSRVLKQFAARPVIFPDAVFAATYDWQARENLARELASLSG